MSIPEGDRAVPAARSKRENCTEELHVSFIMATFNKAPFLDKALNNIREFIRPDDELIIMDGGSTDDTPDIIDRHRDVVSLFESEKDNGPCSAYNKALLKARGRIVVNLNDDDYFFPEGMRKAIDMMDKHPEVDAMVCGGEYTEYDPETKTIKICGYQYLPESKILVADVKHFVYHTSAGYLLLNRRVLPIVGLFDTAIQAADTDYMSRLVMCGANFKYVNVKVFRHVRYPHSRQNNWRESRRDLLRIYARHGEWRELLTYPYANVMHALELETSTLQGAEKLTRAVLKTGFILYYTAGKTGAICQRLGRGMKKVLLRAGLSEWKKNDERREVISEPTWDATLR